MREESKGWISIYRKIQDSWLWQDKIFSKGQAWIDLLLSANHQDKKIVFDSDLITVKRGEVITSIRKLCNKWGWSNSKVKKFLKLLQEDKIILFKCDNKKTTINIVNYSIYQDVNKSENDTETPQKNIKSISDQYQKHTNNNDNNVNNDNNNKYSPNSIEFRLASYLFNFIKRNNEKAKEPNFDIWSKQFDYILRIDKREVEEIKEVIKWSQNDSFWFKNILSPDKLRKQYDKLYLQMKGDEKGGLKLNKQSNRKDETESEGDQLAKRAIEKYGGSLGNTECDF